MKGDITMKIRKKNLKKLIQAYNNYSRGLAMQIAELKQQADMQGVKLKISAKELETDGFILSYIEVKEDEEEEVE